MLGKTTMKFGRLILLGAFVLGATATAEAATTAPRLSAGKPATLVALGDKDKKKAHAHAHKASKPKVVQSHKTKKVKKSKS